MLYGYQWLAERGNIPLDDLQALLKFVAQEDLIGIKRSLKIDMLEFMALRNLGEWIDFEEGTCDFDNDRFCAILEFSDHCAADSDEAEANQLNECHFDIYILGNYQDAVSTAEGIITAFPLPLSYAMLPTGFVGAVCKEKMQDSVETFLR